MSHPLITDAVIEAVVPHVIEPFTGLPVHENEWVPGRAHAREILQAAFAAIEGERKCERCDGTKVIDDPPHPPESWSKRPCPTCDGKGTVREDRLVLLSEVLTELRSLDVITVMRMLDELKPKDRPK